MLYTAYRTVICSHPSFVSLSQYLYNGPSVLFFSGSVWRIEWLGRTRCISRSYDAHDNEAMVWSCQTSRTDTCWSEQFLTSDFDHENRYIARAVINHEKKKKLMDHSKTARSKMKFWNERTVYTALAGTWKLDPALLWSLSESKHCFCISQTSPKLADNVDVELIKTTSSKCVIRREMLGAFKTVLSLW